MRIGNVLIVGVSGKKQSGKNTVCDDLINWVRDTIGNDCCKIYSFADDLKEKVCIDVMGLTHEQCYGTDEQKNTLTSYRWENLPKEVRYHNHRGINRASNGEICEYVLPTGYMTAREIMQIVGTDIFRQYFDDSIWVKATFRNIKKDGFKVAFISDVRFPSEVRGVINEGGYVIRLLRDVCKEDHHSSETSLDNYDWEIHGDKACVIDNNEMSIEEQRLRVIDFIQKSIGNKNESEKRVCL